MTFPPEIKEANMIQGNHPANATPRVCTYHNRLMEETEVVDIGPVKIVTFKCTAINCDKTVDLIYGK